MKQKITIIYTDKTRHCQFCNKFNAYIHIKLKDGKKKVSGYACDQCFKEKVIDELIKEFGEDETNRIHRLSKEILGNTRKC